MAKQKSVLFSLPMNLTWINNNSRNSKKLVKGFVVYRPNLDQE